jgi:hypothetical protein
VRLKGGVALIRWYFWELGKLRADALVDRVGGGGRLAIQAYQAYNLPGQDSGQAREYDARL